MLSIPRRMDNEHGHRIYPIIKHHLHCEHHPKGGYRHIITSHLKHGTKIGDSQTALSVPYRTNPTHKHILSLHCPEETHANVSVSSTIRKKYTKTTTPQTYKYSESTTQHRDLQSTHLDPRLLTTLKKQETEPGGRGPPPPHFCSTQCTITGK